MGKYSFYISAARGSMPRLFGEKSVAYVAIRTSQSRWWKIPYDGGHTILRSSARLRGPNQSVPVASTALKDVKVDIPGQALAAVTNDKVEVEVDATGGDGSKVPVTPQGATPPSFVGKLLSQLNERGSFGGGTRPATVWFDADGYLLIADYAPGVSQLMVTDVKIDGKSLGPFAEVKADNITLLENVPEVLPGAAQKLALEDYFAPRGKLDYTAFIVIPVPFMGRGLMMGKRRGAIHISFSRASYLDALWQSLDRVVPGTPNQLVPCYDLENQVLAPPMLNERLLEGVLAEAVRVLAEVMQPFNDTLYWNRGRH
jgi:hypothetical protein